MTNRSMVAGVTSIISGSLGILMGLGMAFFFIFLFGAVARQPQARSNPPMPDEFFNLFQAMFLAYGVGFALIGVLAIVGGIFALKRKRWGLALAGAIAGSITFYPSGIIAVIFVCLGQNEFQIPKPPGPIQMPVSL